MNVTDQTRPEPMPIPGVAHATWAGAAEGLAHLSVWRQALAPGASTPPHRHDVDEVVICLAGTGEAREGDEVRRFGAGQVVSLPGGREHRLSNVGDGPLELLAVIAATPVATHLPDGSALQLPWRT